MEGKDLMIFTNDKFGDVRVVMKDGEPYFVGKDVAKCLGYVNPTKAIIDHCKGVSKMGVPTTGGIQEMLIIPENDLYRLIMRSELPNAVEFQDWVCDEVLPSIRKNGYYSVAPIQDERATLYMSVIDAPDAVSTALALKNLTTFIEAPLKEEIKNQQEQIAQLKPKSDYCDLVLTAENTFSTSEVAAQLGLRSANALNKFLVNVKFIKAVRKKYFDKKKGEWKERIVHYLLCAEYVEQGLGDVVNISSKSKDGSKNYSNLQLRFTTKGVKFIYELIKEKAPELLKNRSNSN